MLNKPYLSPEGNIAITHANGFVEMVPVLAVEAFTGHPEIKDAFCLVVREKDPAKKKIIHVTAEEGKAVIEVRDSLPLFAYMCQPEYLEPKYPGLLPSTSFQSWAMHTQRAFVALLESIKDIEPAAEMGGQWVNTTSSDIEGGRPIILSKEEYEQLKAMWLTYKGIAKEKASEE